MFGNLEKKRVWLLVLAALMLTLTTLACGGADSTPELTTMLEQADTPEPTAILESTDTPEPTSAPEPTNTSEPTNTLEPTPIVEPPISMEDLEEKWHTPLYAAALTVGAYESLLNTAEKRQAEEIDGMTALGELIGTGVILKTVEDTLPEWEPSRDQIEHKAAIQNYIDAAQEVIGQWLDKEITSADVPGLLEDSYSASQDTLQSVLLAMEDDGLSEHDIEFMLDELSQALDELAQALETEEPTPTDTPEPQPTNTPEATLEPFPSGGLGLSRAEWDQQHTEGDTTFGMVEYDDGKYSVTFADGNIQYLERVFTDDQPPLDAARAEAQTLIPEDSQFLETYSPEGFLELTVDLYMSEALRERFDANWFIGGDPGNFIVIFGVFDGRVPRIVIATGNNP